MNPKMLATAHFYPPMSISAQIFDALMCKYFSVGCFQFQLGSREKKDMYAFRIEIVHLLFWGFFDARLKIQSDTISKQIKGIQSYFQTGKATLKNCINFPCLILLQVYLGAWVFRIWKQKLPIVPDLCLWLLSLWQS